MPGTLTLDRFLIHSQVFPGLCLDIQALLAEELRTVIAVLQQSLNSPEHQAFSAS